MPLTPEDVSNKRFTPVRLREGYDMGEVDQFLDEVEAELARLTRENDDLRSKLSAAQSGASEAPAARPSRRQPATRAVAAAPEPEPTPTTQTPAVALGRRPPVSRRSASRPSARRPTPRPACSSWPAATPTSWSRTPRARPTRSSARPAPRPSASSPRPRPTPTRWRPTPAAAPSRSTARPPSVVRSCSATWRTSATGSPSEVDNLRAFEREYRSRLKIYFSQQLEALESSGSADPTTPAAHDAGIAQPKRLRSVLGDDEA